MRIEKDVLGELKVPLKAYWGINTQRAIINFQISGKRFPKSFIIALAKIKEACLKANLQLGQILPTMGEAITQVLAEIIEQEKFLDQFPLDVFQTGSGTQLNMNMNEVLANRANEILGHSLGKKHPVHPNDHINKSQSSNDVIPSAMHLATIEGVYYEMLPALNILEQTLVQKITDFEGIVKIGRTHLQDAVPISHGGSIEVAFAPEDYISFSYVDAEYAERDPPLFTVGWYHSHPALKIFFSSTDIKNLLGWQTPNPSAIGIVFDHTYLESPGDLGFRTFRLDDPSKGPLTDYHEVKTIVEPPNNIEFYIKIMDLINSIHSKEPPILEINETPDLFGDIMIPGQSQIMQKQPELELTTLLEPLQLGIGKMIELTFEPLIRFLNTWSQDIIKKLVDNNLQMRQDLVALKDNIGLGMKNIQTTVKSTVTNQLYDLDAYIDDKLEIFDKDQETIKASISEMKQEILNSMTELIDVKLNEALEEILKSFEDNIKLIAEITEKTESFPSSLETQQQSLSEVPAKIEQIQTNTLDKIKTTKEKMDTAVNTKIEVLSKTISDLNKQLKDKVADFDTAVSILESTKSEIEKKIKDLQSKAPSGGAP